MKSNVTVGPPVDLLAYEQDAFRITHHRQFGSDDPDLHKIRIRWEQALQQAVFKLPNVRFRVPPGPNKAAPSEESIQLVEPTQSEPGEQISQKLPKASE
ncbi:MAG TPA: hypothetical protein VGG19_00260 [Tepidisphaeraceae bacterium]